MKSRLADTDMLLVGSIPLETTEEVFRWCAASNLVADVASLPDGEVGDRLYWIVNLAYRTYHGHPDIETIRRPAPVNGVESWRPQTTHDGWRFRLRPGVKEIHFGDAGWRLGYARDAVNSHFIFKTLKEKGLIPVDVRFQVCLPATYSGFSSFFPDRSDWKVMAPAYEEAVRAEVETIVNRIPHDELMIQWDLAIETGMIEEPGDLPDALGMVGQSIANLSPSIPADVALGYHLCYGTLGGWPMRHGKDLGILVKAVDLMRTNSACQVDYIHIPIVDDGNADYFSPLSQIDPGDAKLFFGVIHNMRDRAGFENKLRELRKYVSDFGLGAPCGFGREAAGRLEEMLDEHRTALEIYRRSA
jgi:hypothetical protein